MPVIEVDPKLPRSSKSLPGVWSQTLVRRDDAGKVIASLTWLALPHQPGVAQLLDVSIRPESRRKGVGSELMALAVNQMLRHGQLTGSPLRRLMALVNQPEVNVRAWLQRNGFVHVHTLEDLHRTEDVMVLWRTFD